MAELRARATESAFVLVAVSVICTLVTLGAVQGFWLSNLHNGVFALCFGLVGALLLAQRPGQGTAWQFLGVGLSSSILFAGRQVGLSLHDAADAWWGWFGVWPTALVIAQTTWLVLQFPEGFISPKWRRVAVAAVSLGALAALSSALWPVEYASTGVNTPFPFDVPGRALAATLWQALAHPFYAALQLLWAVAIIMRWRSSDSVVRRQFLVLLVTVAGTLFALIGGVLLGGTPAPGLLSISALPIVAGFLLNRLSLAHVVEVERASGRLEELTPRENQVLDLMALGLSNTAIADRLHLSIKTVEPTISTVFRKLGLDDDPASNRRVLAVAEYWRRQSSGQ